MGERISLHTAINQMHYLTDAGVPFRLEFYTMDGRHKVIESATLRPGFSKKQSTRWKFLLAYTDETTGEKRQLHRALLLKLNKNQII